MFAMLQVLLEALYSLKPVAAVEIFLIVSSLIVGLIILALLVITLWKVCVIMTYIQLVQDSSSYSIEITVSTVKLLKKWRDH